MSVIAVIVFGAIYFALATKGLSVPGAVIVIAIFAGYWFPSSPMPSVSAVMPSIEGESWESYDENEISNAIDSTLYNHYNNDNDGITNAIEANYYEMCIASTLNEP